MAICRRISWKLTSSAPHFRSFSCLNVFCHLLSQSYWRENLSSVLEKPNGVPIFFSMVLFKSQAYWPNRRIRFESPCGFGSSVLSPWDPWDPVTGMTMAMALMALGCCRSMRRHRKPGSRLRGLWFSTTSSSKQRRISQGSERLFMSSWTWWIIPWTKKFASIP